MAASELRKLYVFIAGVLLLCREDSWPSRRITLRERERSAHVGVCRWP